MWSMYDSTCVPSNELSSFLWFHREALWKNSAFVLVKDLTMQAEKAVMSTVVKARSPSLRDGLASGTRFSVTSSCDLGQVTQSKAKRAFELLLFSVHRRFKKKSVLFLLF